MDRALYVLREVTGMNRELAVNRDRVRQNRAALVRSLASECHSAPCAERRLGCTFMPGDRAFDRVTGQEVEIVGGTRENIVVSAPR